MVLKSPEQRGASYNKSNSIEGIEGIEGEDIRKMLSAIPPRPDYDTWLRIASAVWSQVGMGEGTRLLQEWSPEEKEGEYAAKHKAKLKQVGVGTLIYYAKQHGFDFVAWKAERVERAAWHRLTPRIANRPATPFKPKGERVIFALTAQQPMPTIDMAETERIAGELLKLHQEGFIVGTDDPDARLYAQALRLFRASFITPTKREDAPPCHEHSIPKTP
jgi:hypothetical protein